MIISREKKYIFVEVPKTGSTAIANKLSEIDCRVLRDQVALQGDRIINVHTHISIKELRHLMGADLDDYSIIGFARDPVGLIISKYFFYRQGRASILVKNGKAKKKNIPKVWLAKLLPIQIWSLVYPFKSSAHFLLESDQSIGADYIGRFDHLQSDVTAIFGEFGYSQSELLLNKVNSTKYNKLAIRQGRFIDRVAKWRLGHDFHLNSIAGPDRLVTDHK
jgi:hypothetical protein